MLMKGNSTLNAINNSEGYISVYALLVMVVTALILNQTYSQVQLRSKLIEKMDRQQDVMDLSRLIRNQVSCAKSEPGSAGQCTAGSPPISLFTDNSKSIVAAYSGSSPATKIGSYHLQARCLDCTGSHCGSSHELVVEYKKVDSSGRELKHPTLNKLAGWQTLPVGGDSLCQFDL